MKEKRGKFSSKIGFVLAAAGSAVGLGNIWRFPYLAAKYGGGTFVICYMVLALIFGCTLMIGEIAIGRKTGLSPIGAFKKLDKRFGFIGVMASIVPLIIFPYYSVIGGWVVKYFAAYIFEGSHAAAAEGYFVNFISSDFEPIGWLAVFIALTAAVVIFGVDKGIEKASKFMMPILIVLTVGLAIYIVAQPGAMEGVVYYLKPDFSEFSSMTVLAATGQLFYSLSLAMGIMITYGSYMNKHEALESSAYQIAAFDSGIAFFAGLMVIPAVFAFAGGAEDAMKAGPGLMFITLPKVFVNMPMGNFIGALFFLLVFFAAFTSAISLMETVVSVCMDRFHWKRRFTCLVVAAASFVLALFPSLGYGLLSSVKIGGFDILDAMDFISNSILMPVVALLACFFIGYVIKPKTVIDEVKSHNNKFRAEHLFTVMVKWIAPVLLIIVLVTSVANALGLMSI